MPKSGENPTTWPAVTTTLGEIKVPEPRQRGNFCGTPSPSTSSFLVAAAFELTVAAGAVDKDPAHCFGGGAKEMRAVGKVKSLCASEPEIGLVDQRRGLEGVAGTFGSHSSNRDRPQFVINELVKPVQGMGISAGGVVEELGYGVHDRRNSRLATCATLSSGSWWLRGYSPKVQRCSADHGFGW